MIKAVIFDMDGVIVDSEPLQSLSWEMLLREKGITPILTKTGLIHEVGVTGGDEYARIMTIHKLDEDLEVVRKERREIYEQLVRQKLELMPGFVELIDLLKNEKFKTAVASSRHYERIHLMLEVVAVKHFFQVIVGPSPQIKRKPEPDIYLHAAAGLGLAPQECLALEDSETGVLSAYNAGMKVIAIPSKYTAHQDFAKANKIVNNLGEITVSMIESFNNWD